MNKPIPLVRLAGSLPGALILSSGYVYVILGCLQGRVGWVFGLVVVGLFYRTLLAVARMKRYNAWEKNWRAMNAEVAGVPAAPKNSRLTVVAAVLLALAIPIMLPQAQASSPGGAVALLGLWALVGLYLVWKLLKMFGRTAKRSAGALKGRQLSKAQAEDNAPVSWLLGRASSAPGRAEVQKQLPDYCARLLSGNSESPRLKAVRSRQSDARIPA